MRSWHLMRLIQALSRARCEALSRTLFHTISDLCYIVERPPAKDNNQAVL